MSVRVFPNLNAVTILAREQERCQCIRPQVLLCAVLCALSPPHTLHLSTQQPERPPARCSARHISTHATLALTQAAATACQCPACTKGINLNPGHWHHLCFCASLCSAAECVGPEDVMCASVNVQVSGYTLFHWHIITMVKHVCGYVQVRRRVWVCQCVRAPPSTPQPEGPDLVGARGFWQVLFFPVCACTRACVCLSCVCQCKR